MRRGSGFDLRQPGKKARFIAKRCHNRMIGMARLPVGQDHNARPHLAQHANNFRAILQCILDSAVGQVERLAPAHAQQPRRFCGFARAIFGGSARSGFALGQIENRRAQAASSHAQQRPAAGLLHVVAMRGNGQHISSEAIVIASHSEVIVAQ